MPAYYISKIPCGFIWSHCRGGLCPMFMSAPALFYSRCLLNFSIDLSSSFYDFTMQCVIKQRPALQQHHRSCVIYDMPVCNCMTCKPPDNQAYQCQSINNPSAAAGSFCIPPLPPLPCAILPAFHARFSCRICHLPQRSL